LNVSTSANRITLGARQALTIAAVSGGFTIRAGNYYVRFTNSYNPGGGAVSAFTSGTSSASSTFVFYEAVTEAVSEPPAETVTFYEPAAALAPGARYVLAMKGIAPLGGSSMQVAMRTAPPAGAPANLGYAPFEAAPDEPNEGLLWTVESYGDGYAVRAADGGEESYLNVSTSANRITLGVRQALAIAAVSGGFTICAGNYYVRFTNSYNPGGGAVSAFTSGTSSASSTFVFYEVVTEAVTVPPEEPETGAPLFTLAAISDLHTDYGIQNREPYIRQGVLDTVARIRVEESANVLLVGGDITSSNSASWTRESYDRAIGAVYEASRAATASGRVLYADGNHDFSAGGAAYNSGDYTGVMQRDTGPFADVLYQEGSAFPHALGYHYVIDGMDFVVLNTAYIGGDNHSNYIYEPGLIQWTETILEKIGKDKTVFIMGHYPFRDSRNISSAGKGMAQSSHDALKAVLLRYPKVIYLYGHDHGGHILQRDTFERITPYTDAGAVIQSRGAVPTGFVSSFVGSMGYYTGSLSAAQPTVVQALLVYVYPDKIKFEMKNYGTAHAGSQLLASYSLARETALDEPEPEPEEGLTVTVEGDVVRAAAGLRNGTDADRAVRVILALYDADGRLIRAAFSVETLAPEAHGVLDVALARGEAASVRAYLWDGLTHEPLSPAATRAVA
jgi:hypothetical protein